MNINFDLKIESEMDMEDVVKEIKERENELLSVEEFQNLKQLYLVKSLMEKCELRGELLKEAENKNVVLKRRNDEFSKLIKRQSDENKMLKMKNEKLCNYLNELQSKLDNMEQHTAILSEEKEEIKQLLKLKVQEVKKLKVEIDVLKSEMEEDDIF